MTAGRLLALLACTVALGACSNGGGTATAEPSTTTVASRDVDDAGRERNEDTARSAALAYAKASQEWLYLDDSAVEAAVREVATDAAAPRLSADVLGEVRTARESLTAAAGPIWWIVRPLATKVVSHGPSEAVVEIWVVTVLSAADVAMPQSDWRTITLELEWQRGAWRVDAVTDVAGPTPMLGPRDRPWAPEELDEALAGFVRLEVDR